MIQITTIPFNSFLIKKKKIDKKKCMIQITMIPFNSFFIKKRKDKKSVRYKSL